MPAHAAVELYRIDEDVRQMHDIVPATILVTCSYRPRYGCRACENDVVHAPATPRCVDDGLPTVAIWYTARDRRLMN